MCVQSYYLNTEYDLELDLLAEIKRLGIGKWQEMVEQKRTEAEKTPQETRMSQTDGE